MEAENRALGLEITALTFSDGTTVSIVPGDTVVIVGPNNSGKSRALADIVSILTLPRQKTAVVRSLKGLRNGTFEVFCEFLEENRFVKDGTITVAGMSMGADGIRGLWNDTNSGNFIFNVFISLVKTEDRLKACNPAPSIAFARERPVHPIQLLYRDDDIEQRISATFRKAFGMDLVVHRAGGKEIPLYCGDRPATLPSEDRTSRRYSEAVEGLAPLKTQGDGIRSFVGVLMEATVAERSIVLVDEPEAFLHPPQARLLGEELCKSKLDSTQIFIATHSRDFLKGLLDASTNNVRIIRMTRENDVNRVSELRPDELAKVWRDPLLRYSNILDGLFHQGVVVCESDADCLLYEAVLSEILREDPILKRPDFLFVHSGGKDRMAVIVRSMKTLGVPTTTVADFDLLNEQEPLKSLVEAHGGEWDEFSPMWRNLKNAIGPKGPELNTAQLRIAVADIVDNVTSQSFPESEAEKIRRLLRRATPWSQAKKIGLGFLTGEQHRLGQKLLDELALIGIFVVPVGELESFFRSADNHGPAFVSQVLERGLVFEDEGTTIKSFVRRFAFNNLQ